MDDPHDPLVGAGKAEALSAEHIRALPDVEPDDLSGRGNGKGG